MLMVTVLLVCLMGFYGWLGWTCGYDRGWADRDEGRPHRDVRKAPAEDLRWPRRDEP